MTEHPDQLPGSYFGPSTLVDLIRHRAVHQDKDVALTYLVDGENEKVTITYGELDRRVGDKLLLLRRKRTGTFRQSPRDWNQTRTSIHPMRFSNQ